MHESENSASSEGIKRRRYSFTIEGFTGLIRLFRISPFCVPLLNRSRLTIIKADFYLCCNLRSEPIAKTVIRSVSEVPTSKFFLSRTQSCNNLYKTSKFLAADQIRT